MNRGGAARDASAGPIGSTVPARPAWSAAPGLVLSYDGSFPGFLCAAAEAINAGRSGSPFPVIRGPASCAELFDETVAVHCDEARAEKLCARLSRAAGKEALGMCFEAFCSDFSGKEGPIARTIARMTSEGAAVLDDLADPDVGFVADASRRSAAQAHKISGLLRFSELSDGSWYAPIEPDCDVLPLIVEHCSERFADMTFAIHDRKRGAAILHKPGQPWAIVEGFSLTEAADADAEERMPLSESERIIRSGWSLYFDTIAITPRKNPRLQMSHMPKKYWRFLPETKKKPQD
jgi:probable DNA metabolism protein